MLTLDSCDLGIQGRQNRLKANGRYVISSSYPAPTRELQNVIAVDVGRHWKVVDLGIQGHPTIRAQLLPSDQK